MIWFLLFYKSFFFFPASGKFFGNVGESHHLNFHRDGNLTTEKNSQSSLSQNAIVEGMKTLYMKKILPLELASKYPSFHSHSLRASDFEAKPMVLILGQYSVGKTSFIRSLLQRDFPGAGHGF